MAIANMWNSDWSTSAPGDMKNRGAWPLPKLDSSLIAAGSITADKITIRDSDGNARVTFGDLTKNVHDAVVKDKNGKVLFTFKNGHSLPQLIPFDAYVEMLQPDGTTVRIDGAVGLAQPSNPDLPESTSPDAF